jgi:hypothetical protein
MASRADQTIAAAAALVGVVVVLQFQVTIRYQRTALATRKRVPKLARRRSNLRHSRMRKTVAVAAAVAIATVTVFQSLCLCQSLQSLNPKRRMMCCFQTFVMQLNFQVAEMRSQLMIAAAAADWCLLVVRYQSCLHQRIERRSQPLAMTAAAACQAHLIVGVAILVARQRSSAAFQHRPMKKRKGLQDPERALL